MSKSIISREGDSGLNGDGGSAGVKPEGGDGHVKQTIGGGSANWCPIEPAIDGGSVF